jgi:hypothetical protein
MPAKRSEVEAATELKHAWGRWRGAAEAGDVAERSGAHGRVRVGENCVIQRIERLKANLESGLAIHVEGAEDAGVDISDSRTTERVTRGIAKDGRNDFRRRLGGRIRGLRRIGERRWIEPCPATGNRSVPRGSVVPTQLMVRLDQAGVLRVARVVDRGGRRRHGKRGAADVAELPIQLEAANDGAACVTVTTWVTLAGCSVTSTRACRLISIAMFFSAKAAKPGCCTARVYVPGRRLVSS